MEAWDYFTWKDVILNSNLIKGYYLTLQVISYKLSLLKQKNFALPAIIICIISLLIVSLLLIPITSQKTPNEFVVEKSSFQPGSTLGGTITVEGKNSLTMIIKSTPEDIPIQISLENNDGTFSWTKEIKGDQSISVDGIHDKFLDLRIKNNSDKPVQFQAIIKNIPQSMIELSESKNQDSEIDKIIRLNESGTIFTVYKGEIISFELGEGFDWEITMDNPTVVEKITLDDYKNSQEIYRVVDLGTVKITGIGNPFCLKTEPPCRVHSTLFEVELHVIDTGSTDVGIMSKQDQVKETEVISLIKKQYPQLGDFPSDGLPPKIIRSEKSNDGWYVIFETLGSGFPILEAECFLVDNSNTVTQVGHYKHTGDMETNISFKTCS